MGGDMRKYDVHDRPIMVIAGYSNDSGTLPIMVDSEGHLLVSLVEKPALAKSAIATTSGVLLQPGAGKVTAISAALTGQAAWLEDSDGNVIWAIAGGANDLLQTHPIGFENGLILKCANLITHTQKIIVSILVDG